MKGVFWYYFDHNYSKLTVYPLDPTSIKKITDKNCNGYCFRVSYFKNQIVCDFFHAICDATGAAEFVKSLVYTYLNLLGNEIFSDQKVLTVGSPVTPEELEDSFLKNYKVKRLIISTVFYSTIPATELFTSIATSNSFWTSVTQKVAR